MFKLNFLLELAGDDISLKSNAVQEVVSSIAKIPDQIKQEVYLRECARLMNMNIEILRQSLKVYSKEVQDFDVVNIDNFQQQAIHSKSFLTEQCERKILQYCLAYGNEVLSFKEVFLEKQDIEGKVQLTEKVAIMKRRVIDKIVFELDNDNIAFTNVMFAKILEKAKLIDLSDFYQLQSSLDAETYLMAEEMRNEELAMNVNAFVNENIIGKEIVHGELHMALEKSINESLLFYKSIAIENMIEEESKKESIDMEFLSMLVELMVNIKKQLNFI